MAEYDACYNSINNSLNCLHGAIMLILMYNAIILLCSILYCYYAAINCNAIMLLLCFYYYNSSIIALQINSIIIYF